MFNFIEKFLIKKLAKKVIKTIPELKEKGVKIIEKHSEEIFEKLEILIIKFIEKYENKQK